MSYQIIFENRVIKKFEKLPEYVLKRIDQMLLKLSENPRPAGVKKLIGGSKDGWRIRIGDYRILYRISDKEKQIIIFQIGPRDDIYRKN